MLQEKYLPVYHFAEKHRIVVQASPQDVYPLIRNLDFSRSKVIRLLFLLRGMPARLMRLEGLNREKFTLLESEENKEIIIGLIGQFWKPNGNLLAFSPENFIAFAKHDFVKASWNFRITPLSHGSIVETETRIFCCDESAKRKFSQYWFFIRPFSGMIRKEILKALKVAAEKT